MGLDYFVQSKYWNLQPLHSRHSLAKNLCYLPCDVNPQAHCLSTLLSNGLDLDIEDYAGDTAKQVAEIYGQTECLKVIEEHKRKKMEKLNREIKGILRSVSPSHRSGLNDSSSSQDRTGGGSVRFKDSPGSSSKGHKIFSNPEIAKKSD